MNPHSTENVILPFEPKISHLSNLYTIPPFEYRVLFVVLLSWRYWVALASRVILLNVALTDTEGLFSSWLPFLCELDHVLIYCSTNTAQYRHANTHSTTVFHTHTLTSWHENTPHWTVLCVHSVKIIYNICSWEVLLYIPCAHEKEMFTVGNGESFSLSLCW